MRIREEIAMLLDELIESGGNLQKGIELNTKLSDAEKLICQYIIEHLVIIRKEQHRQSHKVHHLYHQLHH